MHVLVVLTQKFPGTRNYKSDLKFLFSVVYWPILEQKLPTKTRQTNKNHQRIQSHSRLEAWHQSQAMRDAWPFITMTKDSRNWKEAIKMPAMSHTVSNTTVIISCYHNNWCSLKSTTSCLTLSLTLTSNSETKECRSTEDVIITIHTSNPFNSCSTDSRSLA